mgnify:CR=1 FL=1
MLKKLLLIAVVGTVTGTATAGEVEIIDVEFEKSGRGWDVRTTLRHSDAGWDHYADAWRIVSADGQVVGTRILHHPHVNEQPFTRSLHLTIPRNLHTVYIEARDSKHGWSPQRVEVDLRRTRGPKYRIRR